MKRLILKNGQSPGDILMLTAALRDLHRCHPGEFETDVRTPCPDLWAHNPHLTPLRDDDETVEHFDCHYPLIHRSARSPGHFLNGFPDYLNEKLGLKIRISEFRGDIHLSEEEKSAPSPVAKLSGNEHPYWIIVAGGKYDYTIKWWHYKRYQQVVDALRDEVVFVQVGERGHYHPQLHGVVDQRGKTPLRDLIRLVHGAQGVLCPVTFLMHLAAAVPMPEGCGAQRACVVVAGGRESPHWEAYPWHQFIHNVGSLPCCAVGGCWRSRTVPLGDGDGKDKAPHLCTDVIGGLPRCMDMITPEDVVQRIRGYFKGGAWPVPGLAQRAMARLHLVPSLRDVVA